MRYLNHNPSKNKAGDCVIRAIAGATGKTWEEVLDGLVEVAKELHVSPLEKKAYEPYLYKLGYKKHSLPKVKRGEKRKTSQEIAKETDAIIRQAGHLVYSQGGHVVDTWNSEGRTVYNYYTL